MDHPEDSLVEVSWDRSKDEGAINQALRWVGTATELWRVDGQIDHSFDSLCFVIMCPKSNQSLSMVFLWNSVSV